MKTTPSVVPTASPAQYHRGSGTLAMASTPLTTTTENATMPISGFGKPNAAACGVTMTDPHDNTGLMLQDGTYAGFSSSLIFSMVNVNAAASPTTPAMSTHTALRVGTVSAGRSADGSADGSKPAAVSVTASVRLVRPERERPVRPERERPGRRVPPGPVL